MDIIESNFLIIAAIVLDLTMPIMNGYEVMEKLRADEKYSNIPIVVSTGSNDRESELKALKCGAWDFVAKPYDAGILKFRLANAIQRSMLNMYEQLKKQSETDKLTGLYNEDKFCQVARNVIDEKPEGSFAIIRFDVDRFKQFNSFFGIAEGDRFLNYTANLLRKLAETREHFVYARIESDEFAVCAECADMDCIKTAIDKISAQIKAYSGFFDIVTVFGVYIVNDKSITISQMLDRATMAAKTCKGNYIETLAVYTDELGKKAEREQQIINEMNFALNDNQFCVYYQPKYNISTDRLCGSEALVRWKHPKKGMISPGEFIPIFEKNGFVAKVDYFVWEKTCQYLKKWCDEGVKPEPVSVNISRVNLNNPQIVDMITDLVSRYGIETRLFQLEITESAYMDNPETMTQIVDDFHKNGFTILMDDFGSGYSSLNTLKEIPVDILKIDMKFLPTGENNNKSEKILASVIRMADWIGMPVICEGVETSEQRDFLRSVGCLYVQGYLYGRPMPFEEFDKLLKKADKQENRTYDSNPNNELNSLLSADANTETLLRSIGIPVAIYSYGNGQFDRIRANQHYFDTFGYRSGNSKLSHVSPTDIENVTAAFNRAVLTQSSADCDAAFVMDNGTIKWYRMNIRYIMPNKSGNIVCAVFTEITDSKRVEGEMKRIAGILNQSELEKKTMLIVDDSEVSRILLNTIFNKEYKLIEVNNGKEALEVLNVCGDEINIILLDMLMPVMGGGEFLAVKTTLDNAKHIPVVIISSESDEDVQINMLRSGVNDYITKPFIPQVVYQRVQNVLEYQSRFEKLVSEYRQAISLSPDVSLLLDETYLTLQDTRALIAFMNPIFDVVRIVDPKTTAVVTIDSDNKIQLQPYSCFKVWKKETRCENCSSMCAMQGSCQMTKYEFIENNIFYVVSRPVTIVDMEGNHLKVVMEIVSHVSDSLLMAEIDGVPMRRIMENTRRKIYCDPLTNAYNRRYLYEMLFYHKGRADTTGKIAFIMADMNNFKHINDAYGHTEGDRILIEAANAISSKIRQTDSIIRYGGDEFLVTLTGCTEEHAKNAVEKFKSAISKIKITDTENASAEIGFSYTDSFDDSREMLDEMIKKADENMYHYKKEFHE